MKYISDYEAAKQIETYALVKHNQFYGKIRIYHSKNGLKTQCDLICFDHDFEPQQSVFRGYGYDKKGEAISVCLNSHFRTSMFNINNWESTLEKLHEVKVFKTL
jgi:hypothetical protein